jgi:hypothetical protein
MPVFKLLFSVLGISILVYVVLCGWLWMGQRRLMFFPTAALEATPQSFGLAWEDIWLPVSSGHLHGWWLPASNPTAPTFLYLHGNAGNISTNLDRVILLRSLGASVLTIDYRGYGLSSGPFPSEEQFYEDALAAYHFLQSERGISPQHLIVYGHSLGGAIGIELASRVPQIAALVIEGSFTSMADMATLSQYNGWFPVKWLLTQRFNSLAKVRYLKLPTLYLHGLADASVPASMSQQLYSATAGPKELWLIPNADHNDLTDWAGAEFQNRLRQFLDQHVLVNP